MTFVQKRMLIFFAVLAGGLLLGVGGWLLFGNQSAEADLEVYDQMAPFELEDTLTESTYVSDNDTIKLLSFIFINCPDGACPLTMQHYSQIQDQLKEDGLFGTDVELVTITFDPERDTTEALQEYAGYFDVDPEGWRLLRGSEEQIQAVASDLNYIYQVQEDGSGMHATTQYIIDADHQVRAYHRMSTSGEAMDQDRILDDLYQLVQERN